MNSVDELVRNKILTFPSLMRNRFDVLHHVLCVIGTGSYWVDGKIEYSGRDGRSQHPWSEDYEKSQIDSWTEKFSEPLRTNLRSDLMKDITELVDIVNSVNTRMYEMTPTPTRDFFPQIEYANLMNIPEDVTPEWREACDQMWEIAIAHGWKKP
jgi:hypothetical protein